MSNWSVKIELRTASANPLVKIINFFIAILEALTGIIRSGELIEEDDYLVVHSKQKFLWFFTSAESSLKLARARISGVNVASVRRWFFFSSNTCMIYASGVSDQTEYAVKCSYKEIKERAEAWLK